ncbi:hypothetical protein CIHG_00643 [Coccidioides immitis H538.4]|nr:hypothetical protein CIHG_00643 [Coccidioides immitis H538.4]
MFVFLGARSLAHITVDGNLHCFDLRFVANIPQVIENPAFCNTKQLTMESLTTHPSTAQQAKAFTSPASLSFPGGAGDLTPPSSEKDQNGMNSGQANSQQGANGAAPATPVATPGAGPGVSGIVPTLQ